VSQTLTWVPTHDVTPPRLRQPDLNKIDNDTSMRTAIAATITDVGRLLFLERSHGAPHLEFRKEALRKAVIAFLRTHYNDPTLTAHSLAAHFRISVRTLHAAFDGGTDTVGSTVRGIRIQRASELLAAATLPVSSVALSVGYLDVTHFIRIYKRATGLTPGQWRREHTPCFPAARDVATLTGTRTMLE